MDQFIAGYLSYYALDVSDAAVVECKKKKKKKKEDAVSGGYSPHSYICISYTILLLMYDLALSPVVLVVLVVSV